MREYRLEIKQIVEYPRCRIYKQLIRTLTEDRNISTSGGSNLFYYTVLCSYANSGTAHKNIDGINYTEYPGEWVCRVSEITKWFRKRFRRQTISILDKLQEQQLITYTLLGRGRVVKFKIRGWRHFNNIHNYNEPCHKDNGFFFLPTSIASEIISKESCSEMDIILDLWMNTVYNNENIEYSNFTPVVYIRNGSYSPLIRYYDLSLRWNISASVVKNILKKLEKGNYLSLLSYPGKHGKVICLNNYLETMFQISDVMIDKEEIAMEFDINIPIPQNEIAEYPAAEQIEILPCDSNGNFIISKPHVNIIAQKVSEVLAAQGITCCGCPKSKYKISHKASDCKKNISEGKHEMWSFPQFPKKELFILEIICQESKNKFLFELSLT